MSIGVIMPKNNTVGADNNPKAKELGSKTKNAKIKNAKPPKHHNGATDAEHHVEHVDAAPPKKTTTKTKKRKHGVEEDQQSTGPDLAQPDPTGPDPSHSAVFEANCARVDAASDAASLFIEDILKSKKGIMGGNFMGKMPRRAPEGTTFRQPCCICEQPNADTAVSWLRGDIMVHFRDCYHKFVSCGLEDETDPSMWKLPQRVVI